MIAASSSYYMQFSNNQYLVFSGCVKGTVPMSQLVVIVLIPFKDAVVVDVDVVAELVAVLAELDFIDLAAVVVILVAVETCHIVCCKSCVIQCCLDSCIPAGLAGVSGCGSFLLSCYTCRNLYFSGCVEDLAACSCYVIIELCCLVFELYLIYGDSIFVAVFCLDESNICFRDSCILDCDALCLGLADLVSACGGASDLPALLDDLAIS